VREYSTRLVADVATGKLDVREAASQLQQQAPQTEAFDGKSELAEDEESAEDAEFEAQETV
jgi:type I restriction enzyme S subunit